jgi:acyl-CoA thioester hydrolase
VNQWLIREGGLDPVHGDAIGLVVESRCEYHVPLAYPVALRAGVRVEKLGHRAVTYAVAVFGDVDPLAAAHGHFVHVFVDRSTRQPVPIPARLRDALMRLLTPKFD